MIPALLVSLLAATAAEPIRLQALTPTSGGDGRALLDGDPKTTWTPLGTADDEGVLLRFETPISADGVTVTPCGTSDATVILYANAAEIATKDLGKQPVKFALDAKDLVSVFVRFSSAEDGKGCLADISVDRAGKPLKLVAPRTVNGKVVASSTLTPADAYHPSFLFDGRLDFGWVEGAKGKGEGESVTFTFDQPTKISALELWNGYQRSDDHFKKNARAAQVSVKADTGDAVSLPVKDAQGPQRLTLPSAVTTKSLTLKIEKATPGTKYEDLVLSELRFFDESGPFSLKSDDAEQRRAALATAVKGGVLERVVDRHFAGVCPSESERWATLKLRTNHTFVWYDSSFKEGSRDEVFDGAWVPSGANEVELFGRRHVIEESFDPYAEAAQNEKIRISGGKVKVTALKDVPIDAFRAWYKKTGDRPSFTCLKLTAKDEDSRFTAAREALIQRNAILVEGTALSGVLVED